MTIKETAIKMKECSSRLAASNIEVRNHALMLAAVALEENKDEIFAENRKDLAAAEANGISQSVMKRLKFGEDKLSDVIAGISQLISLEDPLEKTTLNRELDDGLRLVRVTCPIGVIGVIFEARPDALVQISSLCIKSGNCAILKGGKETTFTNRILFRIIKDSVIEAGLPSDCLFQAEAHSEIDELLTCYGFVDLIIPRGSNAFVQHIMNNTRIPVMGHSDGICHVFVEKSADFDKAVRIIVDAKTQYSAACNAVETILVERSIAAKFLPLLASEMAENNVKLNGTSEVREIIDSSEIPDGVFKEYLSLEASVKLVDDVYEAVAHINKFGSHHTDSIISEDAEAVDVFMKTVDSAGVYHNCSTRFADGFRYGFGAEVGISTSKLHARGPVGLEGLVTYKYRLFGNGHIVGDYASGVRKFRHRDI